MQTKIISHRRSNVALFTGAGFSAHAVKLPTVTNLFDFQIAPEGIREENRLKRCQKLKESWDNTHSNEHPEQFVDYCIQKSTRTKEDMVWYVSRRLSTPFINNTPRLANGHRHPYAFDETKKYSIPGVIETQEFIKSIGENTLTGIITTNYDVLLELALGTKGFNYGNIGEILEGSSKPFPCDERYRKPRMVGTIPIAKIHGSISWSDTNRYADCRTGITGKGLIIPPTTNKNYYGLIEDAWNLASNILLKSDNIIIFGFSFNPIDRGVLTLMKENGQSVESVLLIDKAPNKEAAARLFINAEIRSITPDEISSTLINWLD